MKLPNAINTIGFKLSILYLGLFVISFLAIGISVYFLTSHTLEQQLKTNIEAEANRLKSEYNAGGLKELKEEIDEMIGFKPHIAFKYSVINQQGELIAGNFNNFHAHEGWQTTVQPALNRPSEQERLYIRVMALPNACWLAVGKTDDTIHNAGQAVINAFILGFVLVVVLGAVVGFYISRVFLNQVQHITASTEMIIAGNLKHRLPVSNHWDELDQLASVFNRMLDKINSLIENVQQVSNDIAHDLRTPISHLKFRLEDCLSTPLSAQQYTDRIAFAIEEIDTILNTFSALLRISQIESGSRRSGFKTVNFSNIILSVTEALTPVAEEQSKTLRADIAKDIQVIGDKELLTQLVFNLVENAIVHTPEQTPIDVSLKISNNQVDLSVADQGDGIAIEYRQKVLQRFYRLEQSRTTPGNGLGLSIVSAITDLHDGTLSLVDNEPGLKVVFSLSRKI